MRQVLETPLLAEETLIEHFKDGGYFLSEHKVSRWCINNRS